MAKKQIIGTLKKIDTMSKMDETSVVNREIHTVTLKLELIDGEGREHIREVADSLGKPIRLDIEPVQLKLDE